MPFAYRPPNTIGPVAIPSAFLIGVVLGTRRFAHTGWLRFDRALHALVGLERFPGEDAVRVLSHRFTQGSIEAFWRPLWSWLLGQVAVRPEGYSLDLDSTIFERASQVRGEAGGQARFALKIERVAVVMDATKPTCRSRTQRPDSKFH